MDPVICPLIILAVGYLGGQLLKVFVNQEAAPRRSARDEIRRSGEEIRIAMRRTSDDFREHINRETRR